MTATMIHHLESTPDVRAGRLRLAGTRISVDDIVVMYVHLRKPVEEIVASHDLSPASVHAALSYYYEHKAEIDRMIFDDQERAERIRSATGSIVRHKLRAAEHG